MCIPTTSGLLSLVPLVLVIAVTACGTAPSEPVATAERTATVHTVAPTLDLTATAVPTPALTATPVPNLTPTPTPASTPTPTRTPTATPIPTPTPTPQVGFGPGTYQVGSDIQPGIYAGKTGTDLLDSCYWERLRGVSGEFSDIIANDNVSGQFYIEILSSDKYFKIDCDITPLNAWTMPDAPLSKIEPGTYLVGRDIVPGTYRGEAGTDVLESCYWERLSGLSGDFENIIANDNATGPYFIAVQDSDYALSTDCAIERAE